MEGRDEITGLDKRLRGKVVLIVGAGSGVGRGAALRLAREGAALVLAGRQLHPLQETRDLVVPHNAEVLTQRADIANPADVENLVEAARAHWGSVDILVNAAGINVPARALASVSVEDFQKIIAANLSGAFYLARALLPIMRERGGGTIINVASDVALRANAKAGVSYVASKFGMAGLTQSINVEERANGIRACLICPGDINTPLLDKRPMPPPLEARAHMLQAEDIAECIALVATLPARALVEELVVRPTNSPW